MEGLPKERERTDGTDWRMRRNRQLGKVEGKVSMGYFQQLGDVCSSGR